MLLHLPSSTQDYVEIIVIRDVQPSVVWFLILKWTLVSVFSFFSPMNHLVQVWGWFFRFAKPLVLETSQEFGAFCKLRINLVSFILHQYIFNNLHKYVHTLMRSEVLMQEKNWEIIQEKKTKLGNQWKQGIKFILFYPFGRGWLFSWRKGDGFFKMPWSLFLQRTWTYFSKTNSPSSSFDSHKRWFQGSDLNLVFWISSWITWKHNLKG